MDARTQRIDRGAVSRYRCASPLACARLLLSSGSRAAHLPRAGVQSIVFRHAREEGREQRAARAPRLLFVRASMLLHKPPSRCALGVWAVVCVCVCVGVYARAWAGRARKRCGVKRAWEGKEEVRREEGMGEADGVIAGYSWRVRFRDGIFVRERACRR